METSDEQIRRILGKNAMYKAPEGFLERVMNRLEAESMEFSWRDKPIISRWGWVIILASTAGLVWIALLSPVEQRDDSFLNWILGQFPELSRFHFPEISLPKINIPTLPVLIGFFSLLVFFCGDRLIKFIFSRIGRIPPEI